MKYVLCTPQVFYISPSRIRFHNKKRRLQNILIGVIADTHDRLPMVERAVRRLNEEKVEIALHAGDYVAPFVAVPLKQLKAGLIGVFGNNDGDRKLLRKQFSDWGAEIRGKFAEVIIEGLRIGMVHGEENDLLQSLINVGGYDLIIHGHTHEAKTYLKGKTLVINPGEACGYLTGKPTIATLDTKTLNVKIIPL